MRFPIKLNSDRLPLGLRRILPNTYDPAPLFTEALGSEEFSRRVSSVCVDGIWKTTGPGRHCASAELLRDQVGERRNLIALDVGVSDGVTTCDLAETLGDGFSRLYLTDVYLALTVSQRKGVTYFYDEKSCRCVLSSSGRLIYYAASGRSFNPLAWLAGTVCGKAPKIEPGKAHRLSLLNPKLRQLMAKDGRLQPEEWNIMTPWPREKVDMVRAANILNPAYFNAGQLGVALAHIAGALRPDGLLLVVDNRRVEASTLFRRLDDRFVVAGRLGKGCEIEQLTLALVLA